MRTRIVAVLLRSAVFQGCEKFVMQLRLFRRGKPSVVIESKSRCLSNGERKKKMKTEEKKKDANELQRPIKKIEVVIREMTKRARFV